MSSTTIIEKLGTWAAGLEFQDIPPTVVEKIRLQILTSVTASAFSPWHESSKAVHAARKSEGKALVFANGSRLASHDAAYVNAAFAMSLDYDDYMLSGHTGYSAVLVPLAFAHTLEEVIVAAAVANEIMGRLSTNSFIGPLNGQMSSYIHNIGAAVSLGKILNLSEKEMANAMALSLYQPNYSLIPGFWNEGAKTVTASMPIQQGIQAAQLAASGLTGPLDILDSELGFSSVFSFANYPGLYDGLGKTWFSETLCYKRYPGTSYISAGVEGALRATKGIPLNPDQLQSVYVKTTILSATLDQIGAQAISRSPLDANAVNFSLRLSIATALRFGDLTPEVLNPEILIPEERNIREIAKRITVVHDWKQSLQMISASPLGIAMFSKLGFRQWRKLIKHSRKLNRASGSKARSVNMISGITGQLPNLIRLVRKGRKVPVSALDLDTASFQMFQSAHTTLKADNIDTTEKVDIPWGACGRDFEETRELVRWRCTTAFGDSGDHVWEVVFNDESTVEGLYEAVVG